MGKPGELRNNGWFQPTSEHQLGYYVAARHRLKLRKAPGRDIVPAELLATWGPVADSVVYAKCVDRLLGGTRWQDRQLARAGSARHPQATEVLGLIGAWRPLCLRCMRLKLCDFWDCAAKSMPEVLRDPLGSWPGKQAMEITEAIRCTLRTAPVFAASLDIDRAFDQIET